ncbi:uncharacterized protein LOC132259805 [Phlebotomus argentipes]|uniref:uncharacterized protein LOC132259805 n=1 Tax=Phlebotomus argentipes TaxID=94469 RepID=UPI0028930FD7|nr:uncharacterized protein LOC132259805 [Phlebotomus argentipes]
MLGLTIVVLLSVFVGLLDADPDPDCFRNRPTVTPMECCTLPDILDVDKLQECRDEFNASSNEIDTQLPKSEGRSRDHHRGHGGHHRCWHCYTCSYECVFNGTGLMVDGQLEAEKALEYFIEAAATSDPRWTREVIEDAFSACNDKVKIMREKFAKRAARRPPHADDDPECSPIPQHLIRCINGQLYRTCPDDVRVGSEECSHLQEYLNRCHGPLEWKKVSKPVVED